MQAAVIEVFGECPFAPAPKNEVCKLSPEQQKMSAELQGASQDILSSYINYEERSFTIIAFLFRTSGRILQRYLMRPYG